MNATNAAPVNPNKPLQELYASTSAKPWSFSKPIEAVASRANLALHLFFSLFNFEIGILRPTLVSTGQPIRYSI